MDFTERIFWVIEDISRIMRIDQPVILIQHYMTQHPRITLALAIMLAILN